MSKRSGAALALADALALQAEFGHGTDLFCSTEHGFVPIDEPLHALPGSHAAWDQIAAELPTLLRDQSMLRAARALPVLSASAQELDSRYLCRAASILGHLVHAYVRSHTEPYTELPAALSAPWKTLSARLDRPAPFLSAADFVGYNWSLRDPNGQRTLENMDVLIPTLGSDAERVSMLTVTEILAQSGPLIAAVIDCAEGIEHHNRALVASGLDAVRNELLRLTYDIFLKLDPNAWGALHCDPIAWAKLVAPFGAPTRPDEPGFSGTETPTFQLLDALFTRERYDSELGRESRHNRDWLPAGFRALHEAVSAMGLRRYVIKQSDPELAALYQAALDAYAGERGFLGIHRLKLYGYIELGFKTGRAATNGGFSADMGPRAWEVVDDHIEAARKERYAGVALPPSVARRRHLAPISGDASAAVRTLTLDVAGQGLRYRPGDRCALLARNGHEQIERTAKVMRASLDATLPLTKSWQHHLRRHGVWLQREDDRVLVSVRTLLRYARLRPVDRSSVAALHRLTGSAGLHQILEARTEDQWELWALLEQIQQDTNYDLRRLLRAAPWEDESLARLVAPDRYRLYSISSAPQAAGVASERELSLTIGSLEYAAQTEPLRPNALQRGTASSYLLRAIEETEEPFPARVHRPSRFMLPADGSKPVVMFCAGTGIAPFTAFLKARQAAGASGANLLVFGTRDPDHLYHAEALAVWAQRSHLELAIAFSRSAHSCRPDDGELVIEPGVARRVPAMMTDDETLSRRLCELLLDEASGGLGGSAYICGQSAFAQGVIQALTACLTQHFERQGLDTNQATDRARAAYYRMSGAGRFMLDVFTPFKPEMAAGVLGDTAYDASEVALHNDPAHGFWMVIRGQVYDLTEFKEVHPGGAKILTSSAGMDGTRAYEKVEHHLNSEVHAMLDMYKIGRVRRLRLGTRWDYALMPDQMAVFRTDEVFKLWVNRLYAIVELQNAWANDVSVHALALTEGEQPHETTPLKTVLFLESIRRLATRTVDDLCGSDLLELWCATAGIWAQEVPLRRHQEAVDALLEGDARAQALRALDAWGTELRARGLSDEPRRADAYHAALQAALTDGGDALFAELKQHARQAVKVFERHEEAAFDHGHEELVGFFSSTLASIERFYLQLVQTLDQPPHHPVAQEERHARR